jgi:polyribonucleotide nucleotidyltransferase
MIEMQAKGTMDYMEEPYMGIADPMSGMPPINDFIELYKTNEIGEEELLEALAIAQKAIHSESKIVSETLLKIKKPSRSYKLKTHSINEALKDYILANYRQKIEDAITECSKSERSNAVELVRQEIEADGFTTSLQLSADDVEYTVSSVKRLLLRSLILESGKRPDSRGLREVRPITISTGLLPSTHGSALFTRGQTQALAIATLGTDSDKQSYELLTSSNSVNERFSLHYNFPAFSVGEADRVGPPGRRELGHGNLAKRALECLIEPDYDHAIRIVSEVLESNGSSSMATVCAGALAMKSAKVPLIKLASGIAMGLVKEDDRYAILSDIIGLEDYDGDMDFKIAGTRDGITAMQLDIKLGGLNFDLLKDALSQAKEGRLHILDVMENAEIKINHAALPSSEIFHIDASKIVDIIGQAGKTIKDIIEKFEVAIDLDRDKGRVKLTGKSGDKVQAAKEHIMGITATEKRPYKAPAPINVQVGDVVDGFVKKIVDFGAFIDMDGKGEGLMHISKMSKSRVNNVKDLFAEGDRVTVKVLEIKAGKVSLANMAAL